MGADEQVRARLPPLASWRGTPDRTDMQASAHEYREAARRADRRISHAARAPI